MASMIDVQILPMREEDYDDVRALWLTIRGFGIRALLNIAFRIPE